MTPEQLAFIARRRQQIRAWPWMAAVLLLLLAGAYAWLWKTAPHNLDPGAILDEYNMRRLADQELIMLAARGSVAMIGCGVAVLVLVAMASLSLWNEHRLIRLIEEATGGAAQGGAGGSAEVATAPLEGGPGPDGADGTGAGAPGPGEPAQEAGHAPASPKAP